MDSNDPIYVSPSDDGYTEFDDLLRLGAIRELPMYVDTVGGGGGADLPEGVYYRPNQDLDFVDRLSNSGTVRTNSVERRTDAPLPQGMKSSIPQMTSSMVASMPATMESLVRWMISMPPLRIQILP